MRDGRGRPHATPDGEPPWVEVAVPPPGSPGRARWWPVVAQLVLAAVVTLGLVATGGAIVAHKMAERDAVSDALHVSDLLARTTLEPVLSDALLGVGRSQGPAPESRYDGHMGGASRDDVDASPAIARLDAVVHRLVLSSTLVRVKLWTADGRVVYSDEGRLIGQKFSLDPPEQAALQDRTMIGDVSDLSAPENRFERALGSLLEVYRPVQTPLGRELLFETYTRNDVPTRSGSVWRMFAAIGAGSLLLMHLLYAPLSWLLTNTLRRGRRQRDELLIKALAASDGERRRIAGALHDGVVQDLAATSFAVAGSAERARAVGEERLASTLDEAAAGVRTSIGALRSLLVDIYPPNLRMAGLASAIEDLATVLRGRGMVVQVHTEGDLEFEPETQNLVYRVAQECLRNADRHARATQAAVLLRRHGAAVRLDVADNGVGFDPAQRLAAPASGHIGLQLMRDLAVERGARLAVRSRPGAGTRWRLEVDAGVR